MFLHGDVDLEEALIPLVEAARFEGDNSDFLSSLKGDQEFIVNLMVAVQKKNLAFGRKGDAYYVVSTVTTPSFDILEDGAVGNYKREADIITLYLSRTGPLSLDKVIIADEVISNFVILNDSYQTQSAQEQIEQLSSDIEIKLSINPHIGRTGLIREYRDLIHNVFIEFHNLGLDCDMTLSMFDPFSRSLVPVYYSVSDEPLEAFKMPLDKHDRYASVQAFRENRAFEVWHPRKLESEDSRRARLDQKPKEDVEAQRELVGRLCDFKGRSHRALQCMPVTVNRVTVGVVEFASEEKGSFASEREVIRRVTLLAGDLLRRLELANDRGWLTRMQFLYAARHKLERVIQEVSTVAPDTAIELGRILGAAQVDKSEAHGDRVPPKTAQQILRRDIARKFPPEYREALIRKIDVLSSLDYVSRGTLYGMREVFEALQSNLKHSPFQPAALSIFAGNYSKSSSPVIMMSYRPEETWERVDIIDQLCISPISDDIDHTYHYGLFLLGTHVRMSGGIAQGTHAVADDTGLSEFGIAVIFPAD